MADLTREQIESIREWMLRFTFSENEFNTLCDMALRSLERDEDAEQANGYRDLAQRAIGSIGSFDKGLSGHYQNKLSAIDAARKRSET